MRRTEKKNVLVCVLKNARDLRIAREERWYRMPAKFAPRRPFRWLAFYQPAAFGRSGGRIRFYARALGQQTMRRDELLPNEPRHPRAKEPYVRIRVGALRKLPRPIVNTTPRRVSFGFTALWRLRSAADLLGLFGVAPTERLMADALRRARIPAIAQRIATVGGKRYRPDFTVSCRRGIVAVECDNRKAHAGKAAKERDRAKDRLLRRCGWSVFRFRECDITSRPEFCVSRVRRAIVTRGGFR